MKVINLTYLALLTVIYSSPVVAQTSQCADIFNELKSAENDSSTNSRSTTHEIPTAFFDRILNPPISEVAKVQLETVRNFLKEDFNELGFVELVSLGEGSLAVEYAKPMDRTKKFGVQMLSGGTESFARGEINEALQIFIQVKPEGESSGMTVSFDRSPFPSGTTQFLNINGHTNLNPKLSQHGIQTVPYSNQGEIFNDFATHVKPISKLRPSDPDMREVSIVQRIEGEKADYVRILTLKQEVASGKTTAVTAYEISVHKESAGPQLAGTVITRTSYTDGVVVTP